MLQEVLKQLIKEAVLEALREHSTEVTPTTAIDAQLIKEIVVPDTADPVPEKPKAKAKRKPPAPKVDVTEPLTVQDMTYEEFMPLVHEAIAKRKTTMDSATATSVALNIVRNDFGVAKIKELDRTKYNDYLDLLRKALS
jgi:hypothetical protein